MTTLRIEQPGLLSLIQDKGRFGYATLGLSTGGPMDPVAAALGNRLLSNADFAPLIEVSFGGLHLVADGDCQVAVSGATLPVSIEGREMPMWRTLDLSAGSTLQLGFSDIGCRSYLAVRGGLAVRPTFGSVATVQREGIGGLNGKRLNAGDEIAVSPAPPIEARWLAPRLRPRYHRRATVRVIQGYQHAHFPRLELRRFFAGDYTVSQNCDRMGYRLDGPAIACSIKGILSEGIAPGAIQVPADGQPIVLLNDRQTIGGYPKLGAALSLDSASLAQLRPNDQVNFTPISVHTAHNALHLAHVLAQSRRIEPAPK